MSSKTTVAASAEFTHDRFWLNGAESEIAHSERLRNCLAAVRQLAEAKATDRSLLKLHLHIASENNFPTAAGLASSAAGYACLGKCLLPNNTYYYSYSVFNMLYVSDALLQSH